MIETESRPKARQRYAQRLSKQIQKLVVEDQRPIWQSVVDKCDHRTGITHPRRLVRDLSGKIRTTRLQGRPVREHVIYLDPKMISNKFVLQFTPPPIRLTVDISKRQLRRQFHQVSDQIKTNFIQHSNK